MYLRTARGSRPYADNTGDLLPEIEQLLSGGGHKRAYRAQLLAEHDLLALLRNQLLARIVAYDRVCRHGRLEGRVVMLAVVDVGITYLALRDLPALVGDIALAAAVGKSHLKLADQHQLRVCRSRRARNLAAVPAAADCDPKLVLF